MAAWRDEWRASHPPADEHPASSPAEGPAPLSAEPPTIPSPPPPEVHHKQIIKDNLTVRVDESDESVEQINNPGDVVDRQEE